MLEALNGSWTYLDIDTYRPVYHGLREGFHHSGMSACRHRKVVQPLHYQTRCAAIFANNATSSTSMQHTGNDLTSFVTVTINQSRLSLQLQVLHQWLVSGLVYLSMAWTALALEQVHIVITGNEWPGHVLAMHGHAWTFLSPSVQWFNCPQHCLSLSHNSACILKP